MPLFHLRYEAALEYIVEAESAQDAEAAAAKLDPMRDFMDSPDWEISAYPASAKCDPIMGVRDGELLNILDYRNKVPT